MEVEQIVAALLLSQSVLESPFPLTKVLRLEVANKRMEIKDKLNRSNHPKASNKGTSPEKEIIRIEMIIRIIDLSTLNSISTIRVTNTTEVARNTKTTNK